MTLKEYVDGVIRITDDQILENVLTSIVNQLSREGFDLYEIEEYLGLTVELLVRDGGVIADGYDAELDELGL